MDGLLGDLGLLGPHVEDPERPLPIFHVRPANKARQSESQHDFEDIIPLDGVKLH